MSVQTGWATDPFRAAGGRRRYNQLRRVRANVRKKAIMAYLTEKDLSLVARGTQRTLAKYFNVSEATISRDMTGILADVPDPRRCLLCGARALNGEAADHIEGRLAFLVDTLKLLTPDEDPSTDETEINDRSAEQPEEPVKNPAAPPVLQPRARPRSGGGWASVYAPPDGQPTPSPPGYPPSPWWRG